MSQLNAEQIIINIGNNMGDVVNLVVGVAYMLGIVLIASAMFKFRKLSDTQKSMMQQQEMLSPFVNLVIGAGLIWMPRFFHEASITVFGNDLDLLAYQPPASVISPAVYTAIRSILGLIGVIAFVRGMMIIVNSAGGHGGQSGGMGKGLTHIVGGIMCYHIDIVYNVLLETLGITGLFS